MRPRHTKIALIGLALALVLTGPVIGQAAENPHGEGIDSKPYLAQGYAQGPIQAILLQRMQAGCPSETKRAVLVDRRGPLAWFGCWRERNGKVEIAFEDGDFLALEHDAFVWLSETNT